MSKRQSQEHPTDSRKKRRRSDDNSERELIRLSQASLRDLRADRDSEGAFSKCGIVLRMKLKNFMCHEMLEFEFSPSINFIFGPNGSGKSSIMNAICLGLGGKASSTSRGTRISSFVNSKSSSCEINLTVNNASDDAYCSKKYGPVINITRRISKDGSSSYKICDHTGKVKATTYDEVLKMTDHFNIQVDNPVSMLNQETAKMFLNNHKSKDLYKFFLKAAQLDSMQRNYQRAKKDLTDTYDLIALREKALSKLKAEASELSKRLKFNRSVDSLKKKVSNLKMELVWVKIFECQEMIQKKQNEIEHLTQKLNLVQFRMSEAEGIIRLEELRKQEINAEIGKLKERLITMHKTNETLDGEISTKKQCLHESNRRLNVLKAKLRHEKIDYDHLLKQMNEYKSGTVKRYEDEFNEYNSKVKALEKHLESVKSEMKTKENDIAANQDKHDAFSINLKSLMAEKKVLSDQLWKLNDDVRRLEQIRSNDIRRYGPTMPEILKEIDRMYQQNKFKCKPIGPIGLHLKIKNMEWALAIEQCIGKIMNAFICANYDDEAVLQAACQKFVTDKRFLPKIIVSTFETKVYDVSRFRPRCKYLTIYEMVEIANPAIACVLIDQLKIETVLLIPNRAEARALMERNCPENCSQAFLLDGTNVYGSPSYKVYSCARKTLSYFSSDVTGEIKEKETIRINLSSKQQSVDGSIQIVRREMAECSKHRDELQKHMRSYMKDVLRIEKDLSELKSSEIERPPDITFLTEEINRVQNEIIALENECPALDAEHANLSSELDYLLEKRKTNKEIIKNTIATASDLKAQFEAINEKFSNARDNKREYAAEAREIQTRLSVAQKDLSELNKNKTNMEDEAEKKSVHKIVSRRNANSIKSEIIEIEKQITAWEKETRDEKEITEKYNASMDKITDLNSEITRHKAFSEKLAAAIEEREGSYDFFKSCASARCSLRFATLLSSRDCIGSLDFDHENEEVIIQMCPLTNNPDKKYYNIKNLSGGERSFCTICFLLALWDVIDQPVRCLDEFDVFMDHINRTTAMTMMLEASKLFSSNQFIFISPQENLDVDDPNVKIIIMAAPRELA